MLLELCFPLQRTHSFSFARPNQIESNRIGVPSCGWMDGWIDGWMDTTEYFLERKRMDGYRRGELLTCCCR